VQIDADQELPLAGLREVRAAGGPGREVVGERDEHTAVDVAGGVAVVVLHDDRGAVVVRSHRHADEAIEGHHPASLQLERQHSEPRDPVQLTLARTARAQRVRQGASSAVAVRCTG
jgi:hypothetical protein